MIVTFFDAEIADTEGKTYYFFGINTVDGKEHNLKFDTFEKRNNFAQAFISEYRNSEDEIIHFIDYSR